MKSEYLPMKMANKYGGNLNLACALGNEKDYSAISDNPSKLILWPN
jgi:hypothetical protein